MKNIKILKILFVILLITVLAACSSQPDNTEETPPIVEDPAGDADQSDEALELTLTEMKKYNGQNGKPAYIAVDGIIYEVTDVSHWKGGTHNGQKAGIDLTEALNGAPHGKEVLDSLKKVGNIKIE
jgi:predicted heme/steroid binding protein